MSMIELEYNPQLMPMKYQMVQRDIIILSLIFSILSCMPGQAFFVEFDDSLRTFHICFLRWYKVGFIAPFPLDEEHKLSRRICCTNDPFWVQSSTKSPWFFPFSTFLFIRRR